MVGSVNLFVSNFNFKMHLSFLHFSKFLWNTAHFHEWYQINLGGLEQRVIIVPILFSDTCKAVRQTKLALNV